MAVKAFALNGTSNGTVVLCTIRYSAKQVREAAIETEREYLLDQEDYSDQQIWRRLYKTGYRVVPVLVSTLTPGDRHE